MAHPAGTGRSSGSGGAEVHSAFLAIAAAFDVIIETLVLIQRRHPGRLHGGDVDEAVSRTIVGLDEAIALVGIEELYGAGLRHVDFLSGNMGSPHRDMRQGGASGQLRERKSASG